jgi:large subunit ribosomal protein L21
VEPGQTVDVDNLDVVEGEVITLDKVLVIGEDGSTTIGKPFIEGAKVTASSRGTLRGDKVIVYKFKAKTRFRKRSGMHPLITRLVVDKIETAEGEQAEPAEPAPRSKKEEGTSGT